MGTLTHSCCIQPVSSLLCSHLDSFVTRLRALISSHIASRKVIMRFPLGTIWIVARFCQSTGLPCRTQLSTAWNTARWAYRLERARFRWRQNLFGTRRERSQGIRTLRCSVHPLPLEIFVPSAGIANDAFEFELSHYRHHSGSIAPLRKHRVVIGLLGES